jgi:MoaA/NifB/PqqE/SkfB family radical SAM enzyme
MTFYTGDLFEVQVENSSICNAACPQCVRENTPNDKTWFKEQYLSTDFFHNIPDEVYKQIKIMFFCGNLGDPCAAPNFLEVCRLVKSKNPNITIKVSTNGGLRSTEFWSELATIVGDRSEIIFAIDGLEDTNHIYRVNVRWNKIIENVKAFVAAGGKPYWQYITFKHNQHQVEDARKLSEELGFQKFIVKPSHRFALDDAMGVERHGANNIKIEPPEQEELTHKIIFHRTSNSIESLKEQSNSTEIKCHVIDEFSSVYIDHEGHLWPCCYLHSGRYYADLLPNSLVGAWHNIWNNYGKEKINLKTNNWYDILNGEFFKAVKGSWTEDYTGNRIITCAITCGSFKNRVNMPSEFHKIIQDR